MTPGKEATVRLLTLKLKCGLSLQGVVAKSPEEIKLESE